MNRDVLRDAIDIFGIDAQKKMAIEECAELINAIVKEYRGRTSEDDVITELADVSIMVEQLAIFYGYEKFLDERKNKMERLNKRILKHKIIK